MRRPPDKDRSRNPVLSERDVVSSNAVLNAVFGGIRHQKSWMLPAGASVRPSPRTSLSKSKPCQGPSVPSPVLGALSSQHPPDDCDALGSEPYANSPDDDCNNPRHIPINANAHPTVINRGVEDGLRPGVEGGLHATVPSPELQLLASPSGQPQPQLEPQAQNRSPEKKSYSLPASQEINATATDAAMSPSVLSHPERPHQLWSPPESGTEAPWPEPQILSPSPLPSEPSPPPDGQARLASPNSLEEPQPNRPPSSGESNMAPSAWPFSNRPSPFNVMPAAQASSSPDIRSPAPTQQQRPATTAQSLKQLKIRIQQHIVSAGGAGNLNNALERPRFRLLEDACSIEDYFYVALHQIFCIWDLPDRAQVTSIPGLPSSSVLSTSFKVLGSLIRENDGLAYSHKKWFSQFPAPLEQLMKASEPYRRSVVYVGTFLKKLPAEWRSLSADCGGRSYPPLIDELVNRLGVLSPVLQDIIFTASRRNLSLDDGVLGAKVAGIFKRDRREWDALRARDHSLNPPTEKENENRNRLIVHEYLKAVFGQQLHQQGRPGQPSGNPLSARTPTSALSNASAPSPISAAAQAPQTQVIQDQRWWHTPGPNPDSYRGSAPLVLQTPVSTSPHNPPMMSMPGHSPGVLGQQMYTASSSPTPREAFLMQSTAKIFRIAPNGNESQPTSSPSVPSLIIPASSSGSIPFNRFHNTDTRIQNVQQPAAHHPHPQHQAAAETARQHQRMPQQQQQRHSSQVETGRHYPQQQMQQAQFPTPASQRRRAGLVASPQQTATPRTINPSNNRRQSTTIVQWAHPNLTSPQGPVTVNVTGNSRQKSKQHFKHPFLPPLSAAQSAHPPTPGMFALHQAHLRSPILSVAEVSYLEKAQGDPSRRFYQTIKDLSFQPTKIAEGCPLTRFDFELSVDELGLIPKDTMSFGGRPSVRKLVPGALQYRLRCIQPKSELPIISVSEWVVSETSWPENCFVSLNQAPLEIRRKTHHGKDMPIDITQHVLASRDNTNHVAVAIPQWKKNTKSSVFVAIEQVELLQHRQIMDMCLQQQRIPYSQTLDAIKASLSPKDIDDDLAIVVSDLVLSLADPFTTQIFEIPVRGESCLHRECFDLETFLMTRPSAPKRPQQPCMTDVWKCPLCGNDARPYSLRVDEFLISVRRELAARNELAFKAILISQDGSWKPKPEPKPKRKATGDPDEDSSGDERVKKRVISPTATQQNKPKVVEVIELDD